ncbi:MAG: hypothetical protein Q4C81_03545 [Kocuria sp.]|nr:hypothetical protein [Kocuria sp.]
MTSTHSPTLYFARSDVTWLHHDDGRVYLLGFTDPRPRVLEEPAASVWNVLTHTAQSPHGLTVEDIAHKLADMGALDLHEVPSQEVEAGILWILTRLESCGAVGSTHAAESC